MKAYLAARYIRRLELCKYRDELIDLGHEITSTWLDGHDEKSDAHKQQYAITDFRDLFFSDTVINFTNDESTGYNKGGRHVEFGMAAALNKKLIVIGFRENVFHWLPDVEFYDSWESFIKSLRCPN